MSRVRAILLAAFPAVVVFPCAIDNSPRFVPGQRPEQVDTRFIHGELGILTPTLRKRYELIAWRYLSGLPLNSEEQAAVMKAPVRTTENGVEAWRKARGKPFFIVGNKTSSLAPNQFYNNCLDDAFATAAATLSDRKRRYHDDKLINAWVQAQDQVFIDCSLAHPVYPAEPDASLEGVARADRIYQIAAAHFYAEDYPGTLERFQAIAADKNSPWQSTAQYMIARVYLRECSLAGKRDDAELARAQLMKVAADPNAGRFRDSAQQLIEYTNLIIRPSSEFERLGRAFAVPHPGADFAGALETAAYVLASERFQKAYADPDLPEPFDWVRAFESNDTAYAMSRWKETHSELWLVPAIIHAEAKQPDVPALLEAAKKVPESSPAYDTVTYHSIRLTINGGHDDAARARLDLLLAGKPRPLASVDNSFRAQRMTMSMSFDDFLRWAPRRPIGTMEDDDPLDAASGEPVLDDDTIAILNRNASLAQLALAAQSSRLPGPVRTNLALVAMTRALILGDNKVAAQMLPVVARAHLQWVADLKAYADAPPAEKRFAAALMIARHAEFRTDQGNLPNDGWWCPPEPPDAATDPLAARIFSNEELEAAAQQDRRITDAGAAQAFIAPTVMAWAKAHPADPRVPEALGRIVRMTRYGCRWVAGLNNGAISKAAFDLLHQQYPASDWAKKTPYWFKD